VVATEVQRGGGGGGGGGADHVNHGTSSRCCLLRVNPAGFCSGQCQRSRRTDDLQHSFRYHIAAEMTYIVSGGALNSTHSLTRRRSRK